MSLEDDACTSPIYFDPVNFFMYGWCRFLYQNRFLYKYPIVIFTTLCREHYANDPMHAMKLPKDSYKYLGILQTNYIDNEAERPALLYMGNT